MAKYVTVFCAVILCNFVPLFASLDAKDYESIDSKIRLIEEISRLGELTAENVKEPGSCVTDSECLPGGLCYENDENDDKVCHCFRGVSGDYCKSIEECDKNPSKCGDGKDVKCSYDPNNKVPYCRCDGKGRRFDVKSKKCVDQKPCKDYKDCQNAGQCEGKTTKYCRCGLGTYGDYCENIEECINNPNLCGSGNDVKCKYNYFLKRAFCHCLNGTQRYDVTQKKCVEREQCDSQLECNPFGECTEKCQSYEPCSGHDYFEGLSSCHCIEGTSGKNCEIVDDCYNKITDCGTGYNVSCTYMYISGITGHAYCKCTKDGQKFDGVSKLCKDCDCGPMAKGCSFQKGRKVCSCNSQSYDNGDKCEDCKCGEGSKSCKFKNGEIKCICKPGFFVNNNNTCEDCKCGEGSSGCLFKDGNKQCLCNPGYLVNNGKCEKCDCGENSTDCKFENGLKVCTCKPGFALGNYSVCTPICNDIHQCAYGGRCLQNVCVCLSGTTGPFCERIKECENKLCGEQEDVYCKYNVTTEKAYCKCQNTSAIYDAFDKTCKMCSCDSSGGNLFKISWESCEFFKGQKVCQCKKGYAFNPKNRFCSKCYCGPNSDCKFDAKGKKICLCDEGYKEWKGDCKKCDCGIYGVCRFESTRFQPSTPVKVCACEQGYNESHGTCFKCGCGPNGRCDFNSRGETTRCNCDVGFAENSKKCEFCYCGPDSKCSFRNKRKVCECPKGYQNIKGYCKDINECTKNEFCSEPGMLCVNTPGSFRCECKPGYLYRSPDKKNTTPWCEKQKDSQPNYSTWKIGYGVMSAGFILIFIGLVVIIFRIRRNSTTTVRQPELSLGRTQYHP